MKVLKYDEYIDETLITHKSQPLIDRIKILLEPYLISCDFDNLESHNSIDVIYIELKQQNPIVDVSCVSTYKLKDSDLSVEFMKLVEFFNYYITVISLQSNFEIYLEPKYTVNVTKEIEKCKYVYHITDMINLKSILKNGLRVRSGNINGYRYFPAKIFCVGRNDTVEKTIQNLNKVINMKHSGSGYVILEINLTDETGKIPIDFWEDTSVKQYDIENACYTFSSIPKKFIKYYFNINDIK